MKNRIFKIMAVTLAAIFVFGVISTFAAPSYTQASKDYRNMDILNTQNVKINKPTAQFAANRIVNGEVADMVISYADYDCNTPFPTLVCYVGDTLTFTDMSRANNGGKIIEWDWQRFGSLGDKYGVYKRNIVNEEKFTLTQPGETTFFLCVRNDAKVKNGCCDPWSENGNHQIVGKNKWFPKGAYWYFTAVRVVVRPARDAIVNIRFWDAQNNKIFHEGTVNAGQILDDAQTVDTTVHITDWDGYEYSGWNVQLMDGTIQYSGVERDVQVALTGWAPEKYLNIEFYPCSETGVEVRYWDTVMNSVIAKENINGEKVVSDKESTITADIKAPEGYKIDGWNVQLTDGTIQYQGTENSVKIILNGYTPKKFLNVNCFPVSDDNDYDEDELTPYEPPTIEIKPSGICDGVIEWTETDSHKILVGYNRKNRPVYSWCEHTFKYKTVLEATADISPSTLKSGYGFGVDVNCRLNTSLISNSGCRNWGSNRAPSATINNPTAATVFLPWDMTNRLGSQGRSISMVPDGTLRFTLPSSPVSETGAKKLYTPVELAGTKENPQSHSFEIYIGGGGVDSVEFCQKLNGTITINGDMYEDDFSGAD